MSKPISNIKYAQILEDHKHKMPLLSEELGIKAKTMFMYFEKLKKEGFTEQQALEIIKARGLG